MKRIVTLFVVFIFILGTLSAQGQGADVYTQRFKEAPTIQNKFGIVRDAVQDGAGSPEFLLYALNDLLSVYQNVREGLEYTAADEMARFLSSRLGDAKHTEAGPSLWQVVNVFSEPLVRGEALIALGKIKATSYLPHVIQLLADISLTPGKGTSGQEIAAYGAVVSLEEYGDISGYVPVYFASIGWFSDKFKKTAKEVLSKLSSNPTEPLISILKNSAYDYTVKYTALQSLQASDAGAQEKSQGAVAALTDTARAGYKSLEQSSVLAGIRKLAMDMIRVYGSDDAAVYPLLDNCYRQGINQEEQIFAIATLSALGTDEAVRRLSSFLYDLNDKLYWGVLSKTEERMARSIIPALGNTGNANAKNALRSVLQNDWVYDVHKLAQDALKKIP
jgi:hypothetical protein